VIPCALVSYNFLCLTAVVMTVKRLFRHDTDFIIGNKVFCYLYIACRLFSNYALITPYKTPNKLERNKSGKIR
jgi:hypothetical protein